MARGDSVSGRLRAALTRPRVVLACLGLAAAAMIADPIGLAPGVAYDLAWSFAALAASLGCLGAVATAVPEHRRRWRLWSAAALSWLGAQLIWDLYGLIGFASDPNLADAGWWAFALCVMASVLPPRRRGRGQLAIALAEAAPLICAAIGLCLSLLWQTATHSAMHGATRISDLVYPCLYVSAVIVTLQAMLGGALGGLRSRATGLFLAGTATISLAFILWSQELLAGDYVPGTSVLDPLWVLGLGLISLGALAAAHRPEPEVTDRTVTVSGVVLPAGMFLVLMGTLLTEMIAGASHGAKQILFFSLLCSGCALIARSTLLSRRMRGMLAREQATSAALLERETELARLNRQLVEDSRHDPLTGIGNRRALADDLPMFLTRQREAGEPVAVLLCDVDHFKAYNDTFGHLAGDRALTTLTAIVRGVLRPDDAAYRFGGEELLVILRGSDGEGAAAVAERIRAAVVHAALMHPLSEAGVLTVSVGLASGLASPEELIARADAALYAAKEAGRNRVVEADATATATPAQLHRDHQPEEPAARHLRSMLAVSRAAASGRGVAALLEALSEAIRVELSFGVVAVNLLEPSGETFRVRAVSGDPVAREQLLDTTTLHGDWVGMAAVATTIHGALWLPAGRYDHEADASTYWRGPAVAALDADGWHPDDMLLLPLRGGDGTLLGFVSVDQPLLGRRPSGPQVAVLMAVVDHAGLALEQLQLHADATATETDALRLAAVLLLAETLDLRDPSTGSHSRTVGSLACGTAVALGLDRSRVDRIRAAGVLHDLGKLGIPDAILQKPGALDDAEWKEMRRHPEVGARILEHAGLADIAGWVRAHHERVDGRGYPRGLSGAAIPLEARILSVADSFEAMVTDRPYRCGMPVEAARAELLACAGTQFDPEVVDAFLRALDGDGSDCDFAMAPYVGATPAEPALIPGA